jgi:hypothetical protein
MAATLKLGDRKWATKEGSLLAYNDENNNFKPLPFDFTRASSATRINKQGLIETVQSGVPRIDFTDANGALLLEPQRTNLLLQSNQFDTTWATYNSVSVLGGQSGYDGGSDAWLLQANAANGHLRQTITSVSGIVTYSIYAKPNSLNAILIQIKQTSDAYAYFDLSDGSLLSNTNLIDSSIVALSNGWYRVSITANVSASTQIRLYPSQDSDTSITSGSIYIQNAQLELGSYPTSIIPTQISAVTRIGDVCTGAGNDQVINSTEGVLYAEISALRKTNDNIQFIAIGGSVNYTNNSIYIQLRNGLNQLAIWAYSGGVNQLAQIITLTDITSFNKIAIKWKLNDFDVFINGVSVYSLNTYTPPTGLNVLSFDRDGSSPIFCNTKDLRVYNTALTDAELIALTT